MKFRELGIAGAFEITPVQYGDDRGLFLEFYRGDLFEAAVGHPFELRQANTSVSVRGALRGVHFATVPPGQAKYVTVSHGHILDFVIDVRIGSPTFGQWRSVHLDDQDRRAVYVPEGLGHALVALSETASVTYLVSELYAPTREFSVNPLDPALGLQFPDDLHPLVMSERDEAAPSLAEAEKAGILPTWEACLTHYDTLRGQR